MSERTDPSPPDTAPDGPPAAAAFLPVDEQMRRIARGAAEVFPDDELRRKLERSRRTGTPLRIKFGVDPTAPDITLGNAVPFWKLRAFQELGHVAVVIIGDYTAQVGDPSGRNALRPMLTAEQVEANAATYLDQLGHILLPERLEVRRNGEWFGQMSFMEVMQLAGAMTVAQMLERDDFSKRYKSGEPISVHEFLYPLMQGWDSVMVRADVELAGTDQRFNLIVGRDLQRREGQEPQALVINPLLPGTDGVRKMSKSAGNYIGITEPPGEQFGKAMSAPDALLRDWLTSFTDVPQDRIEELCSPDTHPRDAKVALAKGIVTRYWGAAAAEEAAAEFTRVFSRGGVPDDVAEYTLAAGGTALVDLLTETGLAKSRGEVRRLVRQGGVKLDGEKLADADSPLTATDGAILKVGKRRFLRLRASS